jgi:hypothetical protein
MAERVKFSKAELLAMLSAVTHALAGPTEWQDSEASQLPTEAAQDRYWEQSTATLESAADKLRELLRKRGA